jgi:hypothetical protein
MTRRSKTNDDVGTRARWIVLNNSRSTSFQTNDDLGRARPATARGPTGRVKSILGPAETFLEIGGFGALLPRPARARRASC